MTRITNIAEKYTKEIYDSLEKLVNINSFSTNIPGLHSVADVLLDIAEKHGIDFEKIFSAEDDSQRPHLLYVNKDRDDYYAFIGHFDTVHPPESEFNRLLKNGDNWIGPGVNDMKNGVLIALYTLVILKDLMPLEKIPLKILFNSDEEKSSLTSKQIIEKELKNARGGFVFESGRLPGDLIVTSRKGLISLDVEVLGMPSHAGEAPQAGINAIVDAAAIVEKLNLLNSASEGISVHCTEIKGGIARNVVPDHCTIGADIRVPDTVKQEQLIKKVDHLLSDKNCVNSLIEYTINVKRVPFLRTEKSAQLIKKYIDTASSYGFHIQETSSGGVSDANNLSGFGVPVIDGLGAVVVLFITPHFFQIKIRHSC